MNFVGLAKAFLPKDSPWFQRIEQAQQIAAQFPSTKGGLTDLMRQYNINQEKFQQALGALNNPMISGMLNRFQPGLTDKLRGAAQEVSTTETAPSSGALSSGENAVSSLRERLNKFK